jgi:hypothetical protein
MKIISINTVTDNPQKSGTISGKRSRGRRLSAITTACPILTVSVNETYIFSL